MFGIKINHLATLIDRRPLFRTWDQCYDYFLFRQKNVANKLPPFYSKRCQFFFFKKWTMSLIFWENRHFVRQKIWP
jgi:hypothetical protein